MTDDQDPNEDHEHIDPPEDVETPEHISEDSIDSNQPNYDENHGRPYAEPAMEGEESILALCRVPFEIWTKNYERFEDYFEELEQKEKEFVAQRNRPLSESEGSLWYRTVVQAITNAQAGDVLEKSGLQDKRTWQQKLEADGMTIGSGFPKVSTKGKSKEARMARMRKLSGTGTTFDVPLYHSGVWLRMKTPTLAAITSFEYELGRRKTDLGNETKGMAFSNTSQELLSSALNFCLNHVVDANVNYTTPTDLKTYISVLDSPAVLWGLACTLYPDGFNYQHPCMADPENCSHITREKLNLHRLQWTDSVSMTNYQRQHMAKRFNQRYSAEEIARYQEDHTRGRQRMVRFGEIGLMLGVPNLFEHEVDGQAWKDGLVKATQDAMNEPPESRARNQYINMLAITTSARQYSDWVRGVYSYDNESDEMILDTDDREEIYDVLEHVFSEEKYIEKYFDTVITYISDSQISMIAIPSFLCPSCQNDQIDGTEQIERFERLIPIDVLMVFFTLTRQKVA